MVKIQTIQTVRKKHCALLLEADPSWSLIEDYLKRGICFEGSLDEKVVAIMVLLPTRPQTIELVNIAVVEERQNQGIAQEMIAFAISWACQQKFQTMEVGTGSTGMVQLYLYQKCGFRIIGVDQDFFLRHYKEPIFENGLLLRDMVRLSIELKEEG